MSSDRPDFRKMTLEEIKDSISALNKFITEAKTVHGGQKKNFYWMTGAGVAAVTGAAIVFPPALIFFAAFTGAAAGESGSRAAMTSSVIKQAEELRRQLKILYRARPGCKQFNLAARRDREQARPKKIRYYPPRFGGW